MRIMSKINRYHSLKAALIDEGLILTNIIEDSITGDDILVFGRGRVFMVYNNNKPTNNNNKLRMTKAVHIIY